MDKFALRACWHALRNGLLMNKEVGYWFPPVALPLSLNDRLLGYLPDLLASYIGFGSPGSFNGLG